MDLEKYQAGIKAEKIPVRDHEGNCIDWSADKQAILNEETLNYIIGLELGGQAIVGSAEQIGGCFRTVSTFEEEKTKFDALSAGRRKIIKARAVDFAKQSGHSLSWRRELVWVHPSSIPEAYTVSYKELIPEFLRKIREIQHTMLVPRKIWQSWI